MNQKNQNHRKRLVQGFYQNLKKNIGGFTSMRIERIG